LFVARFLPGFGGILRLLNNSNIEAGWIKRIMSDFSILDNHRNFFRYYKLSLVIMMMKLCTKSNPLVGKACPAAAEAGKGIDCMKNTKKHIYKLY
jgi:hypothetical protein